MGGKNRCATDLTKGPVLPLMVKFAAPLMLATLLQQLYGLVDMTIVGRFCGSVDLSAVTVGSDVMNFFGESAIGFAGAAQVIIAQQVGHGENASLGKSVGTIVTSFLLFSVALSLVCGIFSERILLLINTPEESLGAALIYLRCCLFGGVFTYGYSAISAILRGVGDSIHPLMFVAVTAVANLILDALFVAVLRMGVFGAALATVLGQAISFAVSCYYLYRARQALGFDFRPRSFIPSRSQLLWLLRLGVPLGGEPMLVLGAMMFTNSFLYAYGVTVTVVTGIGTRILALATIATKAIGSSSSSMIGQSFGAGDLPRIRTVISWGLALGLAFSTALSAAMLLLPRQIFSIFDTSPGVLELAPVYAGVAVINFFGSALRQPFMGLTHGVGNGRLALVCGFVDGVICRVSIPLLLGLALGLGISGFWYGGVISGYAPAVIGIAYYLSGRWQTASRVFEKQSVGRTRQAY